MHAFQDNLGPIPQTSRPVASI